MEKDIQKKNNAPEDIDFESRQNLVGFFELLFKIDRRLNPDKYNKQKNEEIL
jgi:hypothetical protein